MGRASAGADARRLLWMIAVANDPVALGLLAGAWSGESQEQEQAAAPAQAGQPPAGADPWRWCGAAAGGRARSRKAAAMNPPPRRAARQANLAELDLAPATSWRPCGSLAALYGVTTGNLNLAVRRNQRRFPEDFVFQLTAEEFEALRFCRMQDQRAAEADALRLTPSRSRASRCSPPSCAAIVRPK